MPDKPIGRTAPGVARINGVPVRIGLDTRFAEGDIVEIDGLGKFIAYHEDGVAKMRPLTEVIH